MKRILAIITAMLLSFTVMANPETIRPLVKDNMDNIQVILAVGKDLTPDELYAKLDDELEDIMDYNGFGRRILSKHAKRLTVEEIDDFVEITKRKLFRLYVNLALTDTDFDYEITQVMIHTRNENLAKVSIDLGEKPYKVAYFLNKGKDGNWKIYNVGAEGLNFGMLLRDQFNDLVNTSRNVKLAIVEWAK